MYFMSRLHLFSLLRTLWPLKLCSYRMSFSVDDSIVTIRLQLVFETVWQSIRLQHTLYLLWYLMPALLLLLLLLCVFFLVQHICKQFAAFSTHWAIELANVQLGSLLGKLSTLLEQPLSARSAAFSDPAQTVLSSLSTPSQNSPLERLS